MRIPRPFVLTAAAAALSGWAWSAHAQEGDTAGELQVQNDAVEFPSGLTQGAIRAARRALIPDEPGDGRVWARDANWKASAGPDGFAYIPFFGSDAPKNYPVQFTLSSVTCGGEAVEFNGAPSPTLDVLSDSFGTNPNSTEAVAVWTSEGTSGTTAFAPGDTCNFQCWYRDVQNGMATSNFTNAVAVMLL